MLEAIRNCYVHRTPAEVLAYIKDFSRSEEWDPNTISCIRVGSGPATVGSQWINVSDFLGREVELTYELTRLDDDRVVFVGTNKGATATEDFSFIAANEPGATIITYYATIVFHGVAKMAEPVAKFGFERLADQTVSSLKKALEGHA